MANYGHQSQLAADADGATFSASSEPYEFSTESIQKRSTILDTSGIRGTRSHVSERTRFGNEEIGGTIEMPMDPVMLDNWLPRILGGTETTDSFPLAESLPLFALLIDKGFDVYQYDGCKVSRAVIRATAGELVTLALDIVAKSETGGKSFPALTFPTDQPYRFMDGALTLQSSDRAGTVTDFECVIDNAVNRRYSMGGITPTDLRETDRTVTLNATVAAEAGNSDLYGQALAGAAASLVLTNGSLSTTLDFATLQFPDRSPQVGSRDGEIMLAMEGTARRSGTTAELTVTNVSA
jgi:hypothetical protein